MFHGWDRMLGELSNGKIGKPRVGVDYAQAHRSGGVCFIFGEKHALAVDEDGDPAALCCDGELVVVVAFHGGGCAGDLGPPPAVAAAEDHRLLAEVKGREPALVGVVADGGIVQRTGRVSLSSDNAFSGPLMEAAPGICSSDGSLIRDSTS